MRHVSIFSHWWNKNVGSMEHPVAEHLMLAFRPFVPSRGGGGVSRVLISSTELLNWKGKCTGKNT